jgi:hypothetical protein
MGSILLAPPAKSAGTFNLSTTMIIILVIVLVIAIVGIIGFRAPDRSPGAEEQTERERIDD